ncbi:MAG: hypothetical protein OYI31_01950 [Chloroflexota bacterium]|nr:hypothetical protein [Chloroflexota bacterium]
MTTLILSLVFFMLAVAAVASVVVAWSFNAHLRGEMSAGAFGVIAGLSVLVGGVLMWLTYESYVLVLGSTP